MNSFLLLAAAGQSAAWFDIDTLPTLVASIITILIVLYTTYSKKAEARFKMREIAGLKAFDDAVGRATEMGQPVLYTPGWGGDIQRPTTIASMNILSHVAEKTASYDCSLVFPTHDPVIMAV
ncbi:MAG: hypothetical protein KAU36_00725, partial [candidate division Zixibacteria bacterium]|nr:hypothetical protein [candidate division Zixibacteria bacterium]